MKELVVNFRYRWCRETHARFSEGELSTPSTYPLELSKCTAHSGDTW